MSTRKNSVRRLQYTAALGVFASGVLAAEPPCASIDQRLSAHEAKQLAFLVTRTTGVKNSKVSRSYRFGPWRILLAESPAADPGYLFFTQTDSRLRYVGSWGAGGHVYDSGRMDYVTLLHEFPGIPRKLATCFAWGVLNVQAHSPERLSRKTTKRQTDPSPESANPAESTSPQPAQREWQDWTAVASSSDGTKLAAVARGEGILISKNAGATWGIATSNPDSRGIAWTSISSSADGSVLLAAAMLGPIWLSTDSGASWKDVSPRNSNAEWTSVAISGDGKRLSAAALDLIWTSNDSGATWRNHPILVNGKSLENWYSIASSSDGNRLAVAGLQSGIWTSEDSGSTWLLRSPHSRKLLWNTIAMSKDGSKLAATEVNGCIWISDNFGKTWSNRFPGNRSSDLIWSSIGSSADGSKLTALAYEGRAYHSTDFGHTWTTHQPTQLPEGLWYAVAASADGLKLVAAEFHGRIWTSTNGGETWNVRY